ncbi:dienelactone hydrolase family protein [Paenibacillus methanolicus]|uniref:Dienelactone hydrolase n=1 Tax=Paenibacillus methanolicus TaxID=582686 RepID=A0A5S5CB33_9BACL|nr:dienelactone hydrolase family protein [Paenibacillus methanolicus]TYP76537.1 dienelactone hydrolase [Paenibacillus methanolicus]
MNSLKVDGSDAMICIINGSDTAVIVLHEIYGMNEYMQHLCRLLANRQYDVVCPNLLDRREPFAYDQEEEAYANFMTTVGFARAKDKVDPLLSHMRQRYERLFVVGSSVGATVAWLCGERDGIAGIVGFYGSRIRSYADMTPRAPTLLFFGQEERSFHVPDLTATLNRKAGVQALILPGRHGFADPFSPNYAEPSAAEALHRMLDFLAEQETSCNGLNP